MEALTGVTRLLFLGFFGSHVPITLFVDAQVVLPADFFPQVLRDALELEVATFNDPLMGNSINLLWFQSLVTTELVFQLPFFIVAVYFLSDSKRGSYPDVFRTACIAYGSHTVTTMVPILATLIYNPDASYTERLSATAMYLPYLIFPLWIMWIAATTPIVLEIKIKPD
jgi:hypothetical protein